ncbi:MAG: hypothetical protein IH596_00185 [Bacteroidales bacterium]|nr:hypothetical protein [Bacteroidales bacterium]
MKTKSVLWIILMAGMACDAFSQQGDWTQLNPSDPPDARQGHTMVTLPDGQVIMFGGEGPDDYMFNDLHIFRQNNWEEVIPNNDPPPSRAEHQAWMEGDKMVIYGGQGENTLLNDMWTYDILLNEWAEEQITGLRPTPTRGHTVTVTSEGTAFILGGTDENGQKLRDLWKFDGTGFTQMDNCPKRVSHHIAVESSSILLAYSEPDVISYYQIADDAWGLASGGFPLQGYSSYIKSVNELQEEILFVFGGINAEGDESTTVYVMNLQTGEVTQRQDPLPFPVAGGAAAKYFPDGRHVGGDDNNRSFPANDNYQVLLFGGSVNGTISNATWGSSGNLLSIPDNISDDGFQLMIYPNPTQGALTITSLYKIDKISVRSITGIELAEIPGGDSPLLIDLSSFEIGSYLMQIFSGEERFIRKVMICR